MSSVAFQRADRVGEVMARALADIIQRDMDDPRINRVSITAVEVSRDLQHAKVFFTLLDDAQKATVAKVLNKAKSFLRGRLSRKVQLRVTPALVFHYDESIDTLERMGELLNTALAKHNDSD